MTVTVNGAEMPLPAGTTVAALVASRTGAHRGTAVAVNGEVVPRSAWAATPIHPGDSVELLLAVAGG